MSEFGIKSVGEAWANRQRKNEQDTLEWQVKNLLPYIDDSTQATNLNPMFSAPALFENIKRAKEKWFKRLAIARFVDGHKEHGAALFNMSDDDLRQAYDEEIADAIVYRAEMIRRQKAKKNHAS